MDSFLIKPKFSKKGFKEISLIQWEILTLKNLKLIKRFLTATLIILTIGFITGIIGSEYASFIIFIGVFALITVAILIIGRMHIKRRYRLRIKENIKKLEAIEMACSYTFSDKYVKYQDKEKDLKLNWAAFKCYSIYKDHIVLLLNNSATNFYTFGKSQFDDTDYEKILAFAKLKLQYKKLK